jgi:inosine-uridine nucleoside N-ribohydrolase
MGHSHIVGEFIYSRLDGLGTKMGLLATMIRMKTKAMFAMLAALAAMVIGGLHVTAQPSSHPQQRPPKQQLVILDTDIGDDIDDAFALALLLRSPEVKVLGVTTAFGDTALRARLVERYLAAVGRAQIPVEAGVQTNTPNHLTQAAYARQEPARPQGDGVAFLLREIRAHPGEITLIAIGPLFNVQAAIARDPATFRKLKRVVIMGGSVYRGYDGGHGTVQPPSPEWNIVCDPAGARALLASGVPVFIMPLDSTQIRLTQPELGKILSHASPLTDQLTLLYHEWAGSWAASDAWPMPTLFDPVAVSYAIRPELCPVQPMHLEVDDKGMTRPGPGMNDAQVCLKSDEAGFRQFLLTRILGD